jgi:hypothetical protein
VGRPAASRLTVWAVIAYLARDWRRRGAAPCAGLALSAARGPPGLMAISAAQRDAPVAAHRSLSLPGCGRAVPRCGPSAALSPDQTRPRRPARRPGPPGWRRPCRARAAAARRRLHLPQRPDDPRGGGLPGPWLSPRLAPAPALPCWPPPAGSATTPPPAADGHNSGNPGPASISQPAATPLQADPSATVGMPASGNSRPRHSTASIVSRAHNLRH